MREVVLSGFGAITARGDFDSLDGVQSNSTVLTAGAIPSFDLKNYAVAPKTYLDRCSALALAGCSLALQNTEIANTERFGIVVGTHFGCVATMKSFWDKVESSGARGANSILFSHSYLNSPISLCAIEWNLRGYHTTVCSHSRSGLDAVRTAWEAIALGHADAMLCGGVDAWTPERAALSPDENAGEAAVFFVLRAREETSNEQVLESTIFDSIDDTQLHEAAARWGNCGGANGAIALLLKL